MEEEKLLQILGLFEEREATIPLSQIQEDLPWVTKKDLDELVDEGYLGMDWSADQGILYWSDESD